MKPQFSTFISGVLVCSLASACAGDSDRYPSLAIRDVERAQGQFQPVTPSDPEPIRPVASREQIGAMVTRAHQAHARFIDAQPGVQRLVSAARGKAIDSTDRQLALVALADLTAIRSDTTVPLGDLDMLAAEAAVEFAPVDELKIAQAAVRNLLDEQDRALDALWGELSR